MSYIADYGARAERLLAGQFKQSPRLIGLLRALLVPAADLERTFHALYALRWLDSADGAQLDALGDSLVEPRRGQTDAQYRYYLRAAAIRNGSDGTPDTLIRYVQALTGAPTVTYSEQYPAAFTVEHDGTVVLNLAKRLRSMAPAGTLSVTVEQGGLTPAVY